jgi:hypothetical protein
MYKQCVLVLLFVVIVFNNIEKTIGDETLSDSVIEIPSFTSDFRIAVKASTIQRTQVVTSKTIFSHIKKAKCFPLYKREEFRSVNYTRNVIPPNLQTFTGTFFHHLRSKIQ